MAAKYSFLSLLAIVVLALGQSHYSINYRFESKDFEDRQLRLSGPMIGGRSVNGRVLLYHNYSRLIPSRLENYEISLSCTTDEYEFAEVKVLMKLDSGWNKETITFLGRQIEIFASRSCESDWFGPDCDRWCSPVTDQFDCDPKGARICLGKWFGINCDKLPEETTITSTSRTTTTATSATIVKTEEETVKSAPNLFTDFMTCSLIGLLIFVVAIQSYLLYKCFKNSRGFKRVSVDSETPTRKPPKNRRHPPLIDRQMIPSRPSFTNIGANEHYSYLAAEGLLYTPEKSLPNREQAFSSANNLTSSTVIYDYNETDRLN